MTNLLRKIGKGIAYLTLAGALAFVTGCATSRVQYTPNPLEQRIERVEQKEPQNKREKINSIFITGFGPFGSYNQNPTKDVAVYLRSKGYNSQVLDVDYEDAPKALKRIYESKKPKIIVSMGVSLYAENLNVSIVGQNTMSASIPDASGDVYHEKKINPLLPDRNTIPQYDLTFIQTRFQQSNVNYEIERDAGTYVCNSLLFNGISLTENNPETKFYFFHLPSDIYSNKDKLKNLERGLEALIE